MGKLAQSLYYTVPLIDFVSMSDISLMIVDCAGKKLDLSSPKIMGILNVTPDSFSDGGEYFSTDAALTQARKMIADGADILDIGGESTRPGAEPVSEADEIARVVPVIEALNHLSVPISIDTSKPAVMRAAVKAGASMINDVCALSSVEARQTAATLEVPVCLMHMQGEPRMMQGNPEYADVVREVMDFLLQRAKQVEAAGVHRKQIILDPGFGFGKTLQHNLQLLKALSSFAKLDYALLIGVSRKSFLGKITGKEVEQRITASVAAAQYTVEQGANILRVHDVAETRDMLKLLQVLK